MKKQFVMHELEQMPDHALNEVLDFIQFLAKKNLPQHPTPVRQPPNTHQVEWSAIEEDQAWRDR
jgi:hypothetical protein